MGQDESMKQRSRPVMRTIPMIAVAIWVACMTVPPAMLLRARHGWLEQFDRPGAQEDWEAFRRDMRAQSGRDAPVPGPVQRKVPKSVEPPLKVWLRDHVGLAIVAWVIFGSVLFGFLAAATVGLLAENQPRSRGDTAEEQERDGKNTEQ